MQITGIYSCDKEQTIDPSLFEYTYITIYYYHSIKMHIKCILITQINK